MGQTILVIDDEPVIQSLLRDLLSSEGYVVESAVNGEEGLQRIAELRPDLVLLDLMMPVLDGWAVLKALRERADRPPVIVFSVSANVPGIAERAVAAGACACFPKPFDLGALLDRCRAAVGATERRAPPSSPQIRG